MKYHILIILLLSTSLFGNNYKQINSNFRFNLLNLMSDYDVTADNMKCYDDTIKTPYGNKKICIVSNLKVLTKNNTKILNHNDFLNKDIIESLTIRNIYFIFDDFKFKQINFKKYIDDEKLFSKSFNYNIMYLLENVHTIKFDNINIKSIYFNGNKNINKLVIKNFKFHDKNLQMVDFKASIVGTDIFEIYNPDFIKERLSKITDNNGIENTNTTLYKINNDILSFYKNIISKKYIKNDKSNIILIDFKSKSYNDFIIYNSKIKFFMNNLVKGKLTTNSIIPIKNKATNLSSTIASTGFTDIFLEIDSSKLNKIKNKNKKYIKSNKNFEMFLSDDNTEESINTIKLLVGDKFTISPYSAYTNLNYFFYKYLSLMNDKTSLVMMTKDDSKNKFNPFNLFLLLSNKSLLDNNFNLKVFEKKDIENTSNIIDYSKL